MRRYNFNENKILKDIDRKSADRKKEAKSEVIENAYWRAEEIRSRDAAQMEDFSDVYGSEEVAKDRRYVEEYEERFSKSNDPEVEMAKKYATIFEAIIHEWITKWFGEQVRSIKTSPFDDIRNGVDEVVEFQKEGEAIASRLALAIDVTFSSQLKRKFKLIRDEIQAGKLAEVKYMRGEPTHERGKPLQAPRVIIGAEWKNIQKLAELWMEGKSLDRHPLQVLILEQMEKQASVFSRNAADLGKENVARVYREAGDIIRNILHKKIRAEGLSSGVLEDDRVYAAIKEWLLDFEKKY